MGKAGNVVSADINMNRRKKSKGSALVTFETSEGAISAMNILSGTMLYGRELMLREDRADLMEDNKKATHGHSHELDDTSVASVYVGYVREGNYSCFCFIVVLIYVCSLH